MPNNILSWNTLLVIFWVIMIIFRYTLFLVVLIFIIYTFFCKYLLKKKIAIMEKFIEWVNVQRRYYIELLLELDKTTKYFPNWYLFYVINVRRYLHFFCIFIFCIMFFEIQFHVFYIRRSHFSTLIFLFLAIDNFLYFFMDRIYISPNIDKFIKESTFLMSEDVPINPKSKITFKWFNSQNIWRGLRGAAVVGTLASAVFGAVISYSDIMAERHPDKQSLKDKIFDIIDPLTDEQKIIRKTYVVLNEELDKATGELGKTTEELDKATQEIKELKKELSKLNFDNFFQKSKPMDFENFNSKVNNNSISKE